MNQNKVLLALKIALFLLLLWFVIDKVFIENDIHSQWTLFKQNFSGKKAWLFLIAVALMPVNWMLETIKWRILLNAKVPLLQLIKSIVAGITMGFVTPGRSGEFIGRVVFLEDYSKTRGFYLSSLGGLAQTAASLFIGVPFVFMWSGDRYLAETTMGVAVIYLLAFFRFDLLNRVIASIPILKRYGLIIMEKDLPSIGAQTITLLYSFIRFLTYSLQYVLLLVFFGVSGNFRDLMSHSVVYLLAQTFSPLMPLLDVSFRTGTALLIFKDMTADNLAVLSAVLMVWMINLVIPALAGYWFILRKTKFNWAL